jgi:hypothetical protein
MASTVVLEGTSDESRSDGCPRRLTWAEAAGATVPLISAPAYFGPPVAFLLGPWLLLVLLLVPPAAVLITLVLVVLLAAVLIAALGALIASPYLIMRHLRAQYRERPVKRSVSPPLTHIATR